MTQQLKTNIEIALCIYLCVMMTNCPGERSLSKLKRIQNELRSVMRQDRLNRLTPTSLDHDGTYTVYR